MVNVVWEKKRKDSIKHRAKYTAEAAKYVTPMGSLITDEGRIRGVDAAYSYIGEKYCNPSLKVYIFGGICFTIGLLLGFLWV
jgi:hypothetical protein